jgi:hypothetical protein
MATKAILVIFFFVTALIVAIYFLATGNGSGEATPTTTEGREKLSKEIEDAKSLEGSLSEDELEFDF